MEKNFLYFLFGVLFIEFIIPITEAIVTLIATALGVLRGKLTVKITESNEKIVDLQSDKELPQRIIGFATEIPNTEEEEDAKTPSFFVGMCFITTEPLYSFHNLLIILYLYYMERGRHCCLRCRPLCGGEMACVGLS